MDGLNTSSNIKEQFENLIEKCERNDDDRACFNVGKILFQGKKPLIKPDKYRSLGFFEKSCELGHGEGCAVAAQMLSLKDGKEFEEEEKIKQFWKRSNRLYENECLENNNKIACHTLGTRLFYGQTPELLTTELFSRVEKLLKKGCDELEYGKSCHSLGVFYDHPAQKKKDLALHYYDKSCKEHNNGDSCWTIAKVCEVDMFRFREDQEKMKLQKKFLEYVNHGCNHTDHVLSCIHSGVHFIREINRIKQNNEDDYINIKTEHKLYKNAYNYFVKACNKDSPDGCYTCGNLLTQKNIHTKELFDNSNQLERLILAKSYYQKASDLGHDEASKTIGPIEQQIHNLESQL
eukprot:TRINITY_DN12470_c0_g1_i1.p1 TRINITY_DN12470_c0_g1~~TRINITY_DN12470_c0_g1_i1.p1  ORF type:complete len:348 (+),score=95.18 TRINITY_DN12470_c0_g1_i1:67-1110(+)